MNYFRFSRVEAEPHVLSDRSSLTDVTPSWQSLSNGATTERSSICTFTEDVSIEMNFIAVINYLPFYCCHGGEMLIKKRLYWVGLVPAQFHRENRLLMKTQRKSISAFRLQQIHKHGWGLRVSIFYDK